MDKEGPFVEFIEGCGFMWSKPACWLFGLRQLAGACVRSKCAVYSASSFCMARALAPYAMNQQAGSSHDASKLAYSVPSRWTEAKKMMHGKAAVLSHLAMH